MNRSGPSLSKTSAELKAELVFVVYGINPKTYAVERVTVSRGQILTYFREGRYPSVYKIKGGRPARLEIPRVFKLTDLIWLLPDVGDDALSHPSLAALIDTARAQQRAAGNENT